MDNQEQFLEMLFPAKGIDLSLPEDGDIEPGPTTDVGQNVRWFESLSERGRGGQRSGLSRYIDERVNGALPIQHMNTVVRTDGNALDWHFEGDEFKATGLYLGLDLTDPIIGGENPTGGGGGFQPSESFSENRARMSLAVDDPTQLPNGTATVTATVISPTGFPVAGQTVRLITSRGGAPGDEQRATTDEDGLATFDVTSEKVETLRYLAALLDGNDKPVTRSRNAVDVNYAYTATWVVTYEVIEVRPDGVDVNLIFTSSIQEIQTGYLFVMGGLSGEAFSTNASGVGAVFESIGPQAGVITYRCGSEQGVPTSNILSIEYPG